MRRKAIAFSLIVAATSGCVDQPTAHKSMITSPLQAKGQPQATPIAVTVEDIGPLGPYKITSDGLGEYVSGMQGMTSEIDPYAKPEFWS